MTNGGVTMTNQQRVVIIGGGFGGLHAATSLRHVDVHVTLIDRRNFHLFQPLLYQVATGALSPANIAAPLRDILKKQKNTEVLLVAGIANPRPLKNFLEERIHAYYMMHYNDHHIFSIDDLRDIEKRFAGIEAKRKIILTTEKDAMRLLKFNNEIESMSLYVMPIEHKFLFNEEQLFLKEVRSFIENFKNPS